ncbi:NAD-dependent epimerase/dehydratase family protein [Flavobacterium sufflavum]|uniref:NAD-dependent epimerase/dehydratase family protein n=1 Tax=Flavobacterium sufflavum TaxID=1921138 RepID=A0A437KUJ6_9FLAO|nr:NAD-dependent epimerase/dehydratase family protein [Flavobacterium sufflavum]RVT75853.1 NAD-dependent epimerase/dehydratase family protein [Flavobacterium sufflavum]
MSVLITGSSGFLGGLLKNGFKDEKVFELNRRSGNYQCSLAKAIPNFNETFDFVIHSAGKAHSVPKTDVEKQEFYDINVIGTSNLLKGLEFSGIPKQFVFISSVSVYGQEYGSDIDEKFALAAIDPYGLSKIEAEILVQEWCKKHNVVCTILRLPLLVGKNPPGNLGAMLKAIEKGYYFNIDDGKARKSMVLAEDVAAFIPKVAAVGGIYNLTDGVHPDFNELSVAIAKQKNKKRPFNIPLVIAKLMGYAGDLIGNKAPINSMKLKKITSDLTFDDSKARELLGWKPQSVLEYLKNNNL